MWLASQSKLKIGCFIIKKVLLQYEYEIVLLEVTDINSMNVCPDVPVSCIFFTDSNEGERKVPVLTTEPKLCASSLYFTGVS